MKLNVSEQVELSPAQMDAWKETLTVFSWTASALTHVLYDMLNPDKGHMVATFLGESKVPSWLRAATNGKRVFIVRDRFFPLAIQQRIFLLAHEVGHPMLGHIVASAYYRQQGFIQIGLKRLEWDEMLANMAQDFVINDMLIDSRIGEYIEGGCWDQSIATFRDSWIDVYEKLLIEQENKPKPPPANKCKDGEESEGGGEGENDNDNDNDKPDDKPPPQRPGPKGNLQQNMDGHMDFGSGEPDPNSGGSQDDPADEHVDLGLEDQPPMTEAQYKDEMNRVQQAVSSALELARQRGTLPAAFEVMCKEVLDPVVDWTDHIKGLFARKLGSGGYDFRRPDRRLIVRDIIVPGRSGYGANVVIIGADSSGSIHSVPLLIDRWMGECGGIMEEVQPREVHVVWCDAELQRVDVLTDPGDVAAMTAKGSKGGGGTDFRPVFKYAEELGVEIDCMAYLTDGDGTFPDRAPRFPVIWGDISGNASKYPFGDVVNIPVPKRSTL